MCSSAALAGTVSLVYAALAMPDSLVAKWLIPPLAIAGVTTIDTSGGLPTTVGAVTSVTTPTPAPLRKMKLGINLEPGAYYGGNRIYANLAADAWRVSSASGAPVESYFDANRNVVKVQTGDTVHRMILRPTANYLRKSVDIVCRWDGVGKVEMLSQPSIRNLTIGTNILRYTQIYTTSGHLWQIMYLRSVDASNPLRNLDCRESTADRTTLFDPTYVAGVKRYSTVRFMDWQSMNGNKPVTWATRTTPAMGQVIGVNDGHAIEHMIALANEAKVNPWFCIPWNADDDYVRRFAELVRDTLDPNLVAHVELANEVWNWSFSVTSQARDEGVAKNLSADTNVAMLYRYAEKTAHVMDIWKDVFAGKEKRLVRILAAQSDNPWSGNMMLNFRDTPAHIDALATAPYFGGDLKAYTKTSSDPAAMFAALKVKLDSVMGQALQNKQNAANKGLRYIAYEAGQHWVGEDVALLTRLERDPRMGQLYTYYMSRWNNEVGDLMVLFNDYGSISKFGAWGAAEYIGQPLTEAPKAKAIQLFLASIGK